MAAPEPEPVAPAAPRPRPQMQTMLGVDLLNMPGGPMPASPSPQAAPRMLEAPPTHDFYAAPSLDRPEPAGSKLRTMMMPGVTLEGGVPGIGRAPEAPTHEAPAPVIAAPPMAPAPIAAPAQPRQGYATAMLGIEAVVAPLPAPVPFEREEHTERAEASELAALRAQLQGKNAPAIEPVAAPAPQPIAPAPVAPQPFAAQPVAPQPIAPQLAMPTHSNSVAPGAPRKPQKTMLGMMAPVVTPAGTAAPVISAFAAPAPAPQAPAPQPAPQAPIAAPEPAPVQAAPAPMAVSTAKRVGPSNRTMLGVATPGVAQPNAPIAAPAPAPVAPMPVPMAATAPMPSMPSGEMSIAGLPSPRRRNTGCLAAALALFVLSGAGALAFFGYQRFARAPDALAALQQNAAGQEVLRVELPGAATGTQVRFGANTAPVTEGHAELPLASDSLQLGDNPLAIEVLVPGAAPRTVNVTLTLEYRVRADLTPLASDAPAIHILIEALPGSTVLFNDAPLALDATGHGRGVIPFAALTPAEAGFLRARSDYTITREGHPPVSGDAHTSRIPISQLLLRSPLEGAITDQPNVTVQGRVAANARVRIEGQDLMADPQGAFRLVVPLPAAGADGLSVVHVRACQPGAAPIDAAIHVQRVADIRVAANAVDVDRSITYEQLVERAEARGRTAAFEGQVYNVDVQDGRGILQMLTRPCAREDRCPLWVVYSPSNDIPTGTTVRVVGATTGPQQFRAENGDIRSVPRIEATHVVPTR